MINLQFIALVNVGDFVSQNILIFILGPVSLTRTKALSERAPMQEQNICNMAVPSTSKGINIFLTQHQNEGCYV